MILFVGNIEKGYFVEDIAKKRNLECTFINENHYIKAQVNEILSYNQCTYMIFDIEQYIDEAKDLADEIFRISQVNNAKVIIYASGYLPTADVIIQLHKIGFKNFIFSAILSDMKDDLEKCMNGYFEVNGIDFLEEVSNEIEEKEKNRGMYKRIGVVGSCKRMGTTTQALQIVQYLILNKYKACYVEMNDSGFVESIFNADEEAIKDEFLGKVSYKSIDLFYKFETLSDIQELEYDYYVYDYGVNTDVDFNRTSFLEKDIKIFVVGAKPSEIKYTVDILMNSFYKNVYFIFNFVSDLVKADVIEMMREEERSEYTFFSSLSPDPFTLSNVTTYDDLLQIKPKEIISEDSTQNNKFVLFRKKEKIKKNKEKKIKDKKEQVKSLEFRPKKKLKILDSLATLASLGLSLVIIIIVILFFTSPEVNATIMNLINTIKN